MKITKNYLNKKFEEAKTEFANEIFNFKDKLELEFISKEQYIDDCSDNPIVKGMIATGACKDLEKDYPNFVVVYYKNKDMMRSIFVLPYKVSVSDELAKNVLKKLTAREVDVYLRYAFIHEITHIYEDLLTKKYPDLYEEALTETNGIDILAKESFVEKINFRFMRDRKEADIVAHKLWSKIETKIKKYANKL